MDIGFVAPHLVKYIVTCHVEGCFNCDKPIEVHSVPENPGVMCGPCGNMIEDIVKVEDE
jgi:hypothetical protein